LLAFLTVSPQHSPLTGNRKRLLLIGFAATVLLILASLKFPNSSVPVTIATVLLLYATYWYVVLNYANLQVLHEQVARQERIFIDFGLMLDEQSNLQVWVANLGISSFLIKEVYVRRRDNPSPSQWSVNTIVPVGQQNNQVWFDPRLFISFPANTPLQVDIALRCKGLTETQHTHWKAYTVTRTLRGAESPVSRLEAGLRGPWLVACPKCKSSSSLFMSTDDLTNLDAAWKRQQQLESDLQQSCPAHKSAHLRSAAG
jgi:hypothetical protein